MNTVQFEDEKFNVLGQMLTQYGNHGYFGDEIIDEFESMFASDHPIHKFVEVFIDECSTNRERHRQFKKLLSSYSGDDCHDVLCIAALFLEANGRVFVNYANSLARRWTVG